MSMARFIIACLALTLIAGCTEPFIDIRIDECCGTGTSEFAPGCEPPWCTYPGMLETGSVVTVDSIKGQKFYQIKIGKVTRTFPVPPVAETGPDINKGDAIEIVSEAGVVTIRKLQ